MFYVEVKNEAELADAINWAREKSQKYFLIGDGTNLIPSDKGFAGLIIRNKIKKFEVNNNTVYLGAGNNLFTSIRRLNRFGFGGMEKMAGIPGTVGGAIYGCAGAYGQEIKDRLLRVRMFNVGPMGLVRGVIDNSKFKSQNAKFRSPAKLDDFKNKLRWLARNQCEFSYRDSIFKRHPEWVIIGAEFKLADGDPKVLKKTSAEIVRTRSKKYPPGLNCPGSFFKNIVINQIKPASSRKKFLAKVDQSKINHGKLPAAHLLESVGAKDMKRGGIVVADYHANLIYNTGKGKSADIQALAVFLKNRVKKKFGIDLEEEVRYI